MSADRGRSRRLRTPGAKPAANSHARPLAAIVYDNGQVLLELLQSRAAEEERRRFVEGLRRLDRNQAVPDGS
jgi:hypothetical protein